jgi:circadian clock protein KaiC
LTENILDKLAHQLLHAVRQRGVKRLVIDGIGGFERAAFTQRRLVEFFTALTNELRALGTTTIMTSELRDLSGNAAASPLPDISAILDNLFNIRHEKSEATTKRILSVLKVRDNAFDQSDAEIRFSKAGIAVVPVGESNVAGIEKS